MLVDQIYEETLQIAHNQTVTDVRVGLGYTAVALDNGRCGVAFTLHEKEYESCTVLAEAGTIAGRPASELISWIKQDDETACAVGLATVNALIAPSEQTLEADILEQLSIGSSDAVGMIGYFGPLIDQITKKSRVLHVFERQPIPELGVLPDTAAPDLIPQCQAVIISGTTLLNRTIDGILDLCGNAREVAILGPSTPFLRKPFEKRGVTILSGIQVIDSARVLRIVSEAGGTPSFGSAVRKLSMRISR